MRFLFVSNSKHRLHPSRDASTRYRCIHHAENLRRMGYYADVCTQQDFGYSLTDRYDIYIFHRPRYSRYFEFLLNRLTKRNCLLIADYDDLLFAPRYASESPLVRNGQASIKIATKLHENYRRALQLFDYITASTIPLARLAKEAQPDAKVEVIYNGFSESWLNQATTQPRDCALPLIGYFPGTHSHDQDFAMVASALETYLQSGVWRLFVAGPLELRSKALEKCILRSRHVPYYQLPGLISRCDVSLAPLEDTVFNQCKSGLKFIESALLGVPVIASPIPDMTRFGDDGPLLANTAEEFIGHLEQLTDTEQRTRLAQRSRQIALETCSSRQQTINLIAHVELIRHWGTALKTGHRRQAFDPAPIHPSRYSNHLPPTPQIRQGHNGAYHAKS